MKEFRGTPGPWTIARAGWTDEGNVWYALEGVKEACAPDGRLIATAPSLLEALQGLMEFAGIIEERLGTAETDAARAAIRKALGE